MTIERASVRIVGKPWGCTDLHPWSTIDPAGAKIGELWFERADTTALATDLLLKLLFTREPLSIQVHPDDAVARAMGMEHGKTEAWYVLAAAPGARIALGLKRRLTEAGLQAAIENGSISDEVEWRGVLREDAILVPAGTIHAIGAGLVIAEIQQRSDTTFRLFDQGRHRELHADLAVAAAHAGPADPQALPKRLTAARTLLVASPCFVLERIELPPRSVWDLHAEHETWVLALSGEARIGSTRAAIGDAVYLDAADTGIEAGPEGLTGLVAYLGPEVDPELMRDRSGQDGGVPNDKFSAPLGNNVTLEVRS